MISPALEGDAVRRLGLITAVVTTLAITSCGGSQDGDDAAAKPAKSEAASASPTARQSKSPEKNLRTVQRDVQFAVASHELRFTRRTGFCITEGILPTRKVLGKQEFEAIMARMQQRGWPVNGHVDYSDDPTYGKMGMAFLKSGK